MLSLFPGRSSMPSTVLPMDDILKVKFAHLNQQSFSFAQIFKWCLPCFFEVTTGSFEMCQLYLPVFFITFISKTVFLNIFNHSFFFFLPKISHYFGRLFVTFGITWKCSYWYIDSELVLISVIFSHQWKPSWVWLVPPWVVLYASYVLLSSTGRFRRIASFLRYFHSPLSSKNTALCSVHLGKLGYILSHYHHLWCFSFTEFCVADKLKAEYDYT